MTINYYGLSCFKITSKAPNGREYVLITDPYDTKKTGLRLPRLKAELVVTSQPASEYHNNTGAISGLDNTEVHVINAPGEYEISDIFVQGLRHNQASILYYLELEKIKIAFLGSLKSTQLSQDQIEVLEDLDILIVPIGGAQVINAKQASQVVHQLEPRLVIPCFYKAPGLKLKGLTDTPENFFKELGVKPAARQDKLKITQSDLPQEELKVVWLTF